MVGQSLMLVCAIVISYVALSSNLVLLKPDFIKEENTQKGSSKPELRNGETFKLLHKRNTFDEYGNFDLHYKASTKESKAWFQFTSQKPAYQYGTDRINYTKHHEGQVQGAPAAQDKDNQFTKTGVHQTPGIQSLNTNVTFSITYVGCFSTWEKQYTDFNEPNGIQKYDDTQQHITCAIKCRQGSEQLQISFLKGAECLCAPIYAFKSKPKHQSYCNIPCPVKEFGRSSSQKELPSNPCGGNQGYSVYCISGPENCTIVLEEVEKQRESVTVKQEQVLPQTGKPVAVLQQQCAKCNRSQNVNCEYSFTYPGFDYFPTNSPQKCAEYCGSSVPFVTSDRKETVRLPTEYALLTWWKNENTDLPICSCVDEAFRQILTDVDNPTECNMPCPGNTDVMCGGKEHEYSTFSTVYCIDYPGSDKCKSQETSTNFPSSDGTTEDPCSNEDLGCDEDFLYNPSHESSGSTTGTTTDATTGTDPQTTTWTTTDATTRTYPPTTTGTTTNATTGTDPTTEEATTDPTTETYGTTETTPDPTTETYGTTETTPDPTTETYGTTETTPDPTTETYGTTENATSDTTAETYGTTENVTTDTTTTKTTETLHPNSTSNLTSTTTTSLSTSTTLLTSTPRVTTSVSTTPSFCGVKCKAVDRRGYIWETCAGMKQVVRCEDLDSNSNAKGEAFWKCSKDGHFETSSPNVTGCKSDWLQTKSDEIGNIKDIEDADTFVLKLAEACKNAKLQNSASSFYGHEITDIISLVDKTVSIARQFHAESRQKTGPNFSKLEMIIDKAVDLNAFLVQFREPWTDLTLREKSKISTNLIDKTEQIMFHLTQESNDKNYNKTFAINNTEASNFFILVDTIDTTNVLFNDNYEFPSKTVRSGDDSYVKLPTGWGEHISSKKKAVEIAAISVDSEYVANIMPGQYENLVSSSSWEEDESGDNPKLINGRLVSLTLTSATEKTKYVHNRSSILPRTTETFTGKGVEIIFYHDIEAWGEDIQNVPRKLHEGELPKAVLGSSECVFWDTKIFKWSHKGCKIVKSNRYETVCECNHLTAFAILMDVHRYVGKNLGLQLLTLILCPASEIALFLSILILSSVGGLQRTKATITKNLSICLLVGNALVLFVLDRDYFDMDDGVCVGAAIVTHYVFLCAFMWMLIEGIQLYRMVVHVFDSGRSYIKHFGIFAYGSPLIVIAITAATGYLKGDKPYGGDVYCWLDGPYIWSFMGPVAFVTMVNLVILFIALKTAYQVQQSKNHSQLYITGKMRSYKTWFKGCFSLTVILGLTWVVGFFTLMRSSGGLVAAYIFTILNSSQGLFIFFFNCILNEKVRSLTQRNLSTYFPSWLSSSVSSNPGANDGSLYGKRALSTSKTRESVLSEKDRKRTSARKQISSPVEAKGPIIFAGKLENEMPISAARRFPRTTKVDFIETKQNHTPVQRFDSVGTSSLDSVPSSDTGHMSSDNSHNALISTGVRF